MGSSRQGGGGESRGVAELGIGHSVSPERVLNEYKEYLIFDLKLKMRYIFGKTAKSADV